MSDERIGKTLPEEGLRTDANSDGEEVRIDSPSPVELRRISSQILDVGLEAYGKGMAFAERMEMQASVLSEMRKGKRVVPYHLVLGLLLHRDAAKAVLMRECELAGYPAPVEPTTIQLTTSQAKEIAQMREFFADMWPYAGESYAQRYYRVSREQLDVAVDHHLMMGK